MRHTIWQKELAFTIYLSTAIICFIAWYFIDYTVFALISIICCVLAFIIRRTRVKKPKVIYDIIKIEGRSDLVAVKQVIMPEGEVRWPEFIKTEENLYEFCRVTKTPATDGAYYRRCHVNPN